MDPIGNRMKSQYEDRARFFLPRRTYTIVRVDGKAFHNYTRKLARPHDDGFARAMDATAVAMCEEMQGARLAYIQSDEISVLLADFDKITSSAWFDGNLQKVASVSASIATAVFNRVIGRCLGDGDDRRNSVQGDAFFDARAFTIPDPVEVANYFVWRQQDATRNSVSMAAQSVYSHKELLGKNSSEQQEMLHQKGINWNDYPARFKRGGAVERVNFTLGSMPRSEWRAVEPPVFTRDPQWLRRRIPVHPDFIWAPGTVAA